MKKKRFSVSQINEILKESEAGMATEALCRKHGIHNTTLSRWRSKYGGMELSDMARLKELEDENQKLKSIVAEQSLELRGVKEVLKKKW